MIAVRSPMKALAAALLLAGCGQTGPLYLPERGEVVTRPATPTPSQPPAAPDPAVTPPASPTPPAPPSPPSPPLARTIGPLPPHGPPSPT
jgi:predicted small lipoprotein YifL